MFSLCTFGDLTRFRRKNFKYEAFLITEEKFISCSGVLMAARSAPIEKILEHSQNIPAVEFSDDMPGLESCLDLVYGGSVNVGLENYKTIFKFGKIFEIKEMMDGILSWISEDLDYTEFWGVYLQLKKLHTDPQVFIDIIKKYLSNTADEFIQYTIQLCQDNDGSTFTAVVDLLGAITDKNVFYFMTDIANKAIKNYETPSSSSLPADGTDGKYLQTVVSTTVSYIDKYSKTDMCDGSDNDQCLRVLEEVSGICTNTETFRLITSSILSIMSKKLHPTEAAITPTSTTTDLNLELIKTLTSPSTSYGTIRDFTERNSQGLHPCVTAEIAIQWWSVNEDRETLDMSFVTPLFKRINSVTSAWFYSVNGDDRYEDLVRTLGVTEPPVQRDIFYTTIFYDELLSTLLQCIRTGEGPVDLPKKCIRYTDNMKKHIDAVPVFEYNANAVPPYGQISGHWFVYAPQRGHVSLITNTQQELLSELDNGGRVSLFFVP